MPFVDPVARRDRCEATCDYSRYDGGDRWPMKSVLHVRGCAEALLLGEDARYIDGLDEDGLPIDREPDSDAVTEYDRGEWNDDAA